MNDFNEDIKTFGVFFDFVYHLWEEDTPVTFFFIIKFDFVFLKSDVIDAIVFIPRIH